MADYVELLNAETYEDYLKLVNADVHKNVDMCQRLSQNYITLRIKAEQEKHAALMKLHESLKPFYERRRALVNGAVPTDDELTGYRPSPDFPANEESEYKEGVPFFWLHVLRNARIFEAMEGNDEDAEVLAYLTDVRTEFFPVEPTTLKNGTPSLLYIYRVVFEFRENPYLRNPEIAVKVTHKLSDVEGETEEPTVATETPIEWLPDRDPRYRVVRKRSKKAPGSRPARQKTESFFDMFYVPELVLHNDINDDGTLDDELLLLHDVFACLMRIVNEVVPAAVSFFDETLVEEGEDEALDMDEEDEFVDQGEHRAAHPTRHVADACAPCPQECSQQ